MGLGRGNATVAQQLDPNKNLVFARAPRAAASPAAPRPVTPAAPPVALAPVITPVAAPAQVVATAVNGQLSGKPEDLGPHAPASGRRLALSREVVERIVWEVVRSFAEAIIKEEITRLTKE